MILILRAAYPNSPPAKSAWCMQMHRRHGLLEFHTRKRNSVKGWVPPVGETRVDVRFRSYMTPGPTASRAGHSVY
jgi:hypothetical protein